MKNEANYQKRLKVVCLLNKEGLGRKGEICLGVLSPRLRLAFLYNLDVRRYAYRQPSGDPSFPYA